MQFYAIFSENWWFQIKRFTGLLEFIQLYKQNPLENIFIFTFYQNYTLDLTGNQPCELVHNNYNQMKIKLVWQIQFKIATKSKREKFE